MMVWREDSFGNLKRFEFLEEVIHASKPRHVLDIGCGTGASLTIPLARAFPQIRFLGVDSDRASIAFAKSSHRLPNVGFADESVLKDEHPFDLIIASEVIEHVEDPESFLTFIARRLSDGGAIVLTLPNGYGPFEIASFIQTILRLIGLYGLVRVLYRLISGLGSRINARPAEGSVVSVRETLGISPHINFFSFNQIQQLIGRAGLRVVRYRPRTFLCGFGWSNLLRGEHVLAWNARVADSLPPGLNSDWMLVLKRGERVAGRPFGRGVFGWFRRYLNEKHLSCDGQSG